MTSLPPLGLYIHIPWCLKKCPYCDFNSHAVRESIPEQAYIRALIDDLEADLDHVQGRALSSIFIGGGTPSLFSADSLATLLEAIDRRLPFAADLEITLEANPGTFEADKFRDFRRAGINRLSLGIQSFQDGFLQSLGRVHDAAEAIHAVTHVRAAGFDNFNLDLMFGLPGQTTEQALADLDTALAFTPPHLSWYQLTIEPNTAFYSQPPALPDDDCLADMQEAGIALMADHGLSRYEISAYSRPGRQARHNLNYWAFGDYLGIGAGAHGKITLAETGVIMRTRKLRQPAGYLGGGGRFTAEQVPVPVTDLPLEFMMNALRLSAGCDENLFAHRTGLPLATIAPILSSLRERGLLAPDRLAATDRGLACLNDVLADFLPRVSAAGNRIPVHSA